MRKVLSLLEDVLERKDVKNNPSLRTELEIIYNKIEDYGYECENRTEELEEEIEQLENHIHHLKFKK